MRPKITIIKLELRSSIVDVSMPADDPNIPLQLLIFACQTFMSTVTCIAELSRWEHVSMKEKMDLCALYVPYAVIGKF